jgi:hypothetical protein
MIVFFPADLMAAWLWLWRGAHRSSANLGWASHKALVCRATLVVTTLLLLAPVVAVCWRLAHPHTFSEPARPNPNGYYELVRAAGLIMTVYVPRFETATQPQIKAFVTQCGSVYAPVRAVLDKPCAVPVRLNGDDFEKTIGDVQSLRAIARALYGQGELAAMEGRNRDAAASFTDAVRLGRATIKDGLVVDVLVGITFENMGRSGIAQMRRSLSAEECLALIPRLNDLLDRPALSADVLAREAAWNDNAYGWQGRLSVVLGDLTRRYRSSGMVMEFACNRVLAQSRLLVCELAIRAYSLERGRNPAALADLVPKYLPKVPKDPFDGDDFVYRLTPKGYELHSRQVDFQGKPISADNP